MAQYVWGDTGAPLPLLDYVVRDMAWIRLLPSGSTLLSAVGHGSSYWSQAGKITVRHRDGTNQHFFIKLSETQLGRLMVEGEYESSVALYKISPAIVPRPIGWGTYEQAPDLHFFMCEFVDIYDEQYPPMETFCKEIADLNLRSQEHSPNGMYGFHVTTCNALTPQYVEWSVSWEEHLINSFLDLFRLDEAPARQGPSAELDDLKEAFITKVCPRLLRPLETGGNSIRPTLVHGDIWHSNTARRRSNGETLIFDPSALWAHHEMECHSWQGGRYLFGLSHVKEYFKHFPASEPQEDWPDRMRLYTLISHLHDSIAFPQTSKFRKQLIRDMRYLVNKFPLGYTGTCKRRGKNPEDILPPPVPVKESSPVPAPADTAAVAVPVAELSSKPAAVVPVPFHIPSIAASARSVSEAPVPVEIPTSGAITSDVPVSEK